MYTDMLGEKRYKINLHTHTRRSDGFVSAWNAARIYREAGYDAIAITDHWVVGPGEVLDGLPILPGCEYNFGLDCMNGGVYHIQSLLHERDPGVELTDSIRTCVDKILAAGGIPVLAHPAWSLNDPHDIDKLHGIEFTEIFNTVSGAHSSNRPYSGNFVDLMACRGKFLGLLASDDTHYYDGTDETTAAIMIKADSLAPADIKKALLAGDFYATTGPEVHVSVENGMVKVLCSPCSEINSFTNAAWTPGRHVVGVEMTHAEIPLSVMDKFVRVEVTDKLGRTAYSNIIKIER